MSNQLITQAATLVFPAVNAAAQDYVDEALERGERVVCAASIPEDQAGVQCGEYHQLPSIYATDFIDRLRSLAASCNIERVVSPVSTVHSFLSTRLPVALPEIRLIGESPIRRQMKLHYQLTARSEGLLPFLRMVEGGRCLPDRLELAGILRYASSIYGESNDDKLAAMMAAMASAPQGDVVEVGSLMGRSLFILLYLARRFGIGPVLSVDPWSFAECIQQDSPSGLREVSAEWDFDVLEEGLRLNLAPLLPSDHAHLRLPSRQGHEVYTAGKAIASTKGEPVKFSGQIACIHIDGNHDFEAVAEDCRLWLPHLAPGAWLILDDYVWEHGDGPKRVGNQLLVDRTEDIQRAFACGKALFIQFR